MQFGHESMDKAAKACVSELKEAGGLGGVIALDNKGNGEQSPNVMLPIFEQLGCSHDAIELRRDVQRSHPGRWDP